MPAAPLARSPTVLVLLALVISALGGAPAHAAKAPPAAKPSPDAAAELQTLVFGLADRYVQGYAELLTELTAADTTPAPLRLTVQLEKVHTASAVYSLAAGPSPEAALLDMMALSTLRRLQLEKNLEARFGAAAAAQAGRLVAFSRAAEQEIWTAAARYVSKDQAAELRRLAEAWFAQNADLEFSSLVHFHDFYAANTAGALGEVMRGGSRGMLGPLRDAVASIDEARLVSERAMFLSVRLPLLARWQAEALAYRALTLPESRELLGAAGTLTTAATDMARQLDELPAKLTEERRALLDGATALTGQLGQVVADARTAVDAAQPLVGDARATGEFARATAADFRTALDTLAAIQRTHAASAVGNATPEQVLGALREARQTAEVSLQLVQALERAVASAEAGRPSVLSEALAASEASARRTIDHAAWRAAQVLGGAIVLWGVVAWALSRRMASGK
ncbi:MAG: hypothetical protein IAE82_11370 [Opitutaceae bacterium]|nr:hypothetical protein [Opitutaceae bacterium]